MSDIGDLVDIPFLKLDSKSKGKGEESKWFHFCSAKNIPMVKLVKRKSLGDVDWDYITMSPEDDEFLRAEEDFIKYEIKECLKYYQVQRTVANIGSLTGRVYNLPIEDIEDFALDVCNTLSEAHRRYESTKV